MLLPMRRRLHAAWCELRGETAWTVPAAGWDMVRDLDCSSAGRLSESRDSLARLLESGSGDISRLDASHMRRQLWWADAWLADDSPYGIHFLTLTSGTRRGCCWTASTPPASLASMAIRYPSIGRR